MYLYVFLLHLITDELTKVNISHVSDKVFSVYLVQYGQCFPRFSYFPVTSLA